MPVPAKKKGLSYISLFSLPFDLLKPTNSLPNRQLSYSRATAPPIYVPYLSLRFELDQSFS